MKKFILSVAMIGFASYAMAQHKQQMPPMRDNAEHKAIMEQKKAEHVVQMQKELSLTEAQVAQLKAVHEKYQAKREQERAQSQQLRKQRMEGFKKDRQQMDDEMRKILTPDQYNKWEAKKQERMEARKQKMMQHKGKMKMHERGNLYKKDANKAQMNKAAK